MGSMDSIGKLAFYVGIVISVLLGWMNIPYATLILVIIGIVVGLLNVTAKETSRFLIATIVLVTAGLALAAALGGSVKSILHAFVAFTSAAAVVVALKEVWDIQKNQ